MQSTTALEPFALLQTLILEIDAVRDLESALSIVIKTICQHCQWSYGEAWQLDAQTETIKNRATFYEAETVVNANNKAAYLNRFAQISKPLSFSIGSGIPGRVWASQQWEWHTNLSNVSPDVFLRHKASTAFGIKTAFGIPLIANERTIAVLVFFSHHALTQNSKLIEIIQAIAGPISKLIEQRRTEQQLRDSEARFRSFMEHSPAVIFMKDQQGRFTYANPRLEKGLNLEPNELLGKTDYYRLSADVAGRVRENDAMVIATQQEHSLIEVVPMSDGVERYWQVTKFPFTDHSGQVFVGGVACDITQLKQLEHQLTADNQAQQRTNEALKEAIQAAETANQAKSSFLAMMSHEVRTPMNAMLGMAELLGATALNPKQAEFVNVIRTGGSTLLTVINDILDYSKIESNKLELKRGSIDLYSCVEQVLPLFSNQAEAKGLGLSSLIDPTHGPTQFQGDATRLQQVLSNLISNSIKFTSVGDISLEVTVNPIESNEQEPSAIAPEYDIQFSIKDTGIGISPEQTRHLFKPFSQVDSSVTRQYGGTGLGLAISKQLIEMMGGQIEIDSEVGKGSNFYFSVRLAADGQTQQRLEPEIPVGLNKHLLIIDSDDANRFELTRQAQAWGLTVEAVASARAAITKLVFNRSRFFDVITINATLSDIDSTQLAQQIRSFQRYQEVPLILIREPQQAYTDTLNRLNNPLKLLQHPVRQSQFYNVLMQLLHPEKAAPFKTLLAEQPQHDATKVRNKAKGENRTDENKANSSLRILLTEDIFLNQRVALEMLSSCGYQADVAQNGAEALLILQQQPYDLVFMDVQMPVMDGLEATSKIRLSSEIKQPYIIAMTAHAMQGARDNCIAAGMNDYIQKPICKRDLSAAIQQCLSVVQASKIAASALVAAEPAEFAKVLPTFDIQNLESIAGSHSFLREVCDSFLEDAPQRISAIRAAIERRDALALGETVHALKSLSGCVGALKLVQICQSMETANISRCVESTLSMMMQVNSEYTKVEAAIQRHKASLSA